MENYEEVKQIMQSFDLVLAVNTLVVAWEGIKPELIQTCFHTAGFMTYVPPPPEPLPEPPRNLWERMQIIFDVNCTFEEYATADDHAESSQTMTDEDIIMLYAIMTVLVLTLNLVLLRTLISHLMMMLMQKVMRTG